MSNTNSLHKLLEEKYKIYLSWYSDSLILLTSDDKYLLAAGKDNTLRRWKLLNNKQEHPLEIKYLKELKCLCITNNSKYLVYCGFEKDIHVWNLEENIDVWLTRFKV